MLTRTERLRDSFSTVDEKFMTQLNEVGHAVDEVKEKSEKNQKIFHNIDSEIKDIDKEFSRKTGIVNKKDLAFLWTAVALQTIRWILLPKLQFDMENPDISTRGNANTAEEKKILDYELDEIEDADIESIDDGNVPETKESKYLDKVSYYLRPVPYDAMTGEAVKNLKLPGVKKNPNAQLTGKNHHSATLGHDPVLGYFFGSLNIMTYTITFHKLDLETHEVLLKPGTWIKEVGDRCSFLATLKQAIDAEIEDPLRIPFAVGRHQIHMMTDENTKMGLPIPFLPAALQQSLLEKGWNSQELNKIIGSLKEYRKENLSAIGLQFIVALIINIIIKSIHLLLYNEQKDEDFDLYRVRTSRIIATSSVIAESINLAFVGGSVAIGVFSGDVVLAEEGIKSLDIGGYIECVRQIVSNKSLQEKIRREFLVNKIDEKIDFNYSFMED